MNIIVTVDKNWAIGKNGKQFVNIPENDKLIRQETEGKVVVMTKNAYEQFEYSFSLGNRKLIVVTRDEKYAKKGVIVISSMEELENELAKYNTEDVFILGGAYLFGQLYNKADMIHVTKIDYVYEADRYFPKLDELEEFVITARSDEKTYFDLEYEFIRYEKVK